MFVHDGLADPQAQTGADIFLGREEGFEKMLAIFCGNAWTGIGDGDPHASQRLGAVITVSRDSNANLPATMYCVHTVAHRSEERRVGKECRSRRSPYH